MASEVVDNRSSAMRRSPSMAWKPIPGALEERRHTAKLTREELSRRSGISKRGLGGIETGETETVHLATLRKLTRVLKCSDTELATWVPNRHLTARRRLWVPSSTRDVLLRLGEDSAVAIRLDTVVDRHIHRVLKACDFNRELAAQVLGVQPRDLDKVTGLPTKTLRRRRTER